MVVSRKAVKQYINRKLKNSDKAKRFSLEAINSKLAKLKPKPEFVFESYLHQKICFLLALKYPAYGMLLDMGTGKTKLMLDLFSYQRKLGKTKRMLVLVPCSSNVEAWRDECKLHAPKLKMVGFDDIAGQDRIDALNDTSIDIIVLTYAGWMRLITEKMLTKDRKKSKLKISDKIARKLEKLFDFCVFDESTFMGGNQSIYFKACKRLSKVATYHYILTGTPFGYDPHLLWSQFFTIDFGDTLGETLGMFRAAFFKESKNFWSKGMVYTFDKSKTDLLYSFLRNSSIRYKDSECKDMPELITVPTPVVFTKETWSYYENLIAEMVDAKGNFRVLDNVYVRMRQLASGYLCIKDAEGDKHTIKFKDNPKLSIMIEILKSIPEGASVLIFHDYVMTGRMITECLKKHKIKHGWLYSKTKNKKQVQRNFRSGKVKVLVANQAAAFGLNLQIAQYGLMFEPVADPIIRKQMIKRFQRGGSKHKRVYLYNFFVKKSIEPKIIKAAQDGDNFFNACIEGKSKRWLLILLKD